MWRAGWVEEGGSVQMAGDLLHTQGASCSLFFFRPSADCTFSTTLTFTRSLFAVRLPFSHFHQHTGTQRPSPYVTSLPPELLLRCSRRARACTRTHTSNILRGNVCPGGREQLSAAQWSACCGQLHLYTSWSPSFLFSAFLSLLTTSSCILYINFSGFHLVIRPLFFFRRLFIPAFLFSSQMG